MVIYGLMFPEYSGNKGDHIKYSSEENKTTLITERDI